MVLYRHRLKVRWKDLAVGLFALSLVHSADVALFVILLLRAKIRATRMSWVADQVFADRSEAELTMVAVEIVCSRATVGGALPHAQP